MPVGLCMRSTAVSTLFTFWPPAPLARAVVSSMSCSEGSCQEGREVSRWCSAVVNAEFRLQGPPARMTQAHLHTHCATPSTNSSLAHPGTLNGKQNSTLGSICNPRRPTRA